ncbi:MAG TPA: trigger factor [Methylococcaceae bacterium]|nr:trigger factor [Methylococcaceae bacterium]
MQVTVETVSELSRKMTVRVPGEKIREQIASRLKSLARDVRVDGFRPGKAPRKLVEQRFGGQVREEVVGDAISSSLQEAFQQEKLRPAGMPRITPTSLGEESDLEYVADFEVYPEVKLNPLEQLQIHRPASEIAESDLQAMVERLREQRRTWRVVERPAARGDQVNLRFEGTMGGESFTGGMVENFSVTLGAGQLIAGFEDQLTGNATGATLNFSLPFPEDYFNEELRGKTGDFSVEMIDVRESVLPDVDADFARSFGVENGDVATFLADVRENMEREMQRAIQSQLKNATLDALYAANPLTLPDSVVDEEVEHLLTPHREDAKRHNRPLGDESVLRTYLRDAASRRVALGMLLGEIIREGGLDADKTRVREVVESIAQSYEKPEEVVRWYYSQPERLRDVEHRVLEDEAVEWVLQKAQVTDEPVPFARLMQPAQAGANADAEHVHDEHCGHEH